MPLVPTVSVLVPLPFWIVTPPELLTTIPCADWLAFRFTVCGEVTLLILKLAMSKVLGGVAGSGVVALLEVDQELAVFQPVPVPSQ
jgi:hypothetical protein